MTVAEIQRIGSPEISKADARQAFLAYKRGILNETDAIRKREYEALMRGYRAIAQGKQVLDLHQVMRSAGVQDDSKKLPKLAICRADAKTCNVRVNEDGSARFVADDAGWRATTRAVSLPADTLPRITRSWQNGHPQHSGQAVVPIIPAMLRPRHDLANYHILWDAVWMKAPPIDPLLLKHLSGGLYAIVTAWDLTPLERAVLMGRL